MIVVENIIKNSDFFLKNFNKRGFSFDFIYLKTINLEIKNLKTEIYKLNNKHNLFSSLIKNLKFLFFKYDYLVYEILFLKKIISNKKDNLSKLEEIHKNYILNIPNILHFSVPYGNDESDNVEIRVFDGSNIILEKFENDLESNNYYIDFDFAAKLAKSGFVLLKKELALLHRALGNYMLDLHIFEHGYEEIYSPLIVNKDAMTATGHLPKFHDDLFDISNTNLFLIPTSEVVLSNLVSGLCLKIDDLPLNYVSKTACFRKEKGSYGYKVRGLIRQHQFDKVELVKIVSPKLSYDALDELVFHAERVLQNLNLSYRVISLCSKDVGFASSKTYDLEVWFPKRKMYIEVSSCSNTESFQAIRMKTKLIKSYFNYPHILNGSGLAIGRVLLAIIENYSDSLGNLIIPNVLIQYMNGKKLIEFK